MQEYSILDNQVHKILGLTYNTWKTIFTVLSVLFIFTSTLIFFLTFGISLKYSYEIIYVNRTSPALHVTDKNFISVAFDASNIANGLRKYDFTNKKFIKMVMHLQPAYMRIGGTMADRLHFALNQSKVVVDDYPVPEDGGECASVGSCCECMAKNNFTMTGNEWLTLNKFASKTGTQIIFGLNALIRKSDGSWDSRNAEKLIRFSNRHHLNVHWELGNEPNAFKHQFNYSVNATQMAKDFLTLRSVLDKYQWYKKCLLLGPDVTRPQEEHKESELYLKDFLPEGRNAVDVITWHQYYLNGRTATSSDFVDPDVLSLLQDQISIVKEISRNAGAENKSIWLGETSSAYGGGAYGLSDKFIGMFLWADKLGLAAKMGLKVVVRQSLVGGYYGLLDDTYEPNPDWWYSVLYKHLVGNIVVDYYSATYSDIRLYVHCTPNSYPFKKGSTITVFGINYGYVISGIRIQGIDLNSDKTIHEYKLVTDYLFGKNVFLNSYPLELTDTYDPPNIVPKILKGNHKLTIPPYSAVFWVIPDSDVAACV